MHKVSTWCIFHYHTSAHFVWLISFVTGRFTFWNFGTSRSCQHSSYVGSFVIDQWLLIFLTSLALGIFGVVSFFLQYTWIHFNNGKKFDSRFRCACQSQRILFWHKQTCSKHEKHGNYLHNGIMHNIGTQLIYNCCEYLFFESMIKKSCKSTYFYFRKLYICVFMYTTVKLR